MADFECPGCSRPIFNRRLRECEFCGAPLPEELLLSESDQEARSAERSERAKQQREVERARQRERRRRQDTGDFGLFFE